MKLKYIFTLILILFFVHGFFAMSGEMKNKQLTFEFIVNAAPEKVFDAWTTKQGLESFFGPECKVELKLFGDFFIYFFSENPPGQRGAEDEKVISFEKNKMLSFTWGFPPSLMDLRENQKTVVLLRFTETEDGKTKVSFISSGWGEGENWRKGFEYFRTAWGNAVLPRLVYRFENGPIDWHNMPDYSRYKLAE